VTQVLSRSIVPPHNQMSAWVFRRRLSITGIVIVSILSAGVSLASLALAAPSASFTSAVAQARAATGCQPLRHNPIVEQVAEISNQTSNSWIDHNGTKIPVKDPHVGLHDLCYSGKKGQLLNGAAKSEVDAIHGALLEGYDKFPDCTFTDFGVSLLRNEKTGYYLTSVVLAG
jgi:Zn-dependent metalloprotease